eukprot:COSAG04_NODE_1821_length_5499_cov_33.155000_8_plen_81_part_00
MSGRLLLLARRRAAALRQEGDEEGDKEARGAAAPRAEVAGSPGLGAPTRGDGLLTSEQFVTGADVVVGAFIGGAESSQSE